MQSVCPPFTCTRASSFLRHRTTAMSTVDCSPDLNQPLPQFVNGADFLLVNTTVHISQSTGLRSGLFRGQKSGKMKSDVSRCRSRSTVSRAWCSGRLLWCSTVSVTVPRTNLTVGQRAFSWSSVFIWNSIPLSLLETLLPSVHSNAG